MSSLYDSTIETEFIQEAELALTSKVRLSGEAFLYESVARDCQSKGIPSIKLIPFARAVDSLVQKHFLVFSPKIRDQQDILYQKIQLKPQKALCLI